MQDSELAKDIVEAAQLTGSFELRSGQISDTYFDKYRFESDPVLLARIAKAMVPLIPDSTEILAGLELGGVPVATALSMERAFLKSWYARHASLMARRDWRKDATSPASA